MFKGFKDLDEIDEKILDMLAENARMSYVDVGNAVGLSRVAAKARVQALESAGIIDKYVTVINLAKLDNTVSLYLDLELEPRHVEEAIARLQQTPNITQIYLMTGASKLHAHAVVSSDGELERLITDVVYTLPGLIHATCETILRRIKDVKGIRL
ncbi:Lrp/AsnC family transcriptional regulator [Oscillibacter sp. MSJ-2]|uniref:Lrp/AsnC family transcriptional regulator n=1 Tax=Dysosmobacter acutus TaxID=2841504 RepID=A0ABS6FAQ0_9FIRM|nr:Lrp/AsnC family transcriptional regulator [Dysosmobacter acutus]MBU5627364.1 Lrp/AsnC family transcriptional regulator [Dysosmobacter acutus]